MTIKAVLFDLGDTLLNFGRVDIDYLFGQGARLTYDYLRTLTPAVSLPGFTHYRRAHVVAIKLHCFWARLTRREFDCIALLRKGTRRFGLRLDDVQLEHLASLWYQPLAQKASLEPELHGSLNALRQGGLKLAIISNTFIPEHCHEEQLDQLGLRDYFDLRLYSSSVILQKPDRRIYRMALEILNVSPRETVMVGDKFRYDIMGPRRLGIQTVFKVNSLNAHKVRALPAEVPTINTIAELPALLSSGPVSRG